MKTETTGLDQDTPIEIIWQDETAVAVNKPAGLLVHNSKWAGPKETSLRQMVARQIDQQVYPVHRLDRPTSGVLIYALSRETARLWHDQLARPDTHKTYIALARGWLAGPMTVDHPLKDGKTRRPALTHFRPVAYCPQERVTLVQARPRTGRQHQIRRHLARTAHQIIGDTTYGKGRINRYFRETYDLHRLFLHAIALDIAHPVTGERLHLQAGLPPELLRPLHQLFPDDILDTIILPETQRTISIFPSISLTEKANERLHLL
jgi:tRNA pseudouridine65 synthase